jgi:hypothetical protein
MHVHDATAHYETTYFIPQHLHDEKIMALPALRICNVKFKAVSHSVSTYMRDQAKNANIFLH